MYWRILHLKGSRSFLVRSLSEFESSHILISNERMHVMCNILVGRKIVSHEMLIGYFPRMEHLYEIQYCRDIFAHILCSRHDATTCSALWWFSWMPLWIHKGLISRDIEFWHIFSEERRKRQTWYSVLSHMSWSLSGERLGIVNTVQWWLMHKQWLYVNRQAASFKTKPTIIAIPETCILDFGQQRAPKMVAKRLNMTDSLKAAPPLEFLQTG